MQPEGMHGGKGKAKFINKVAFFIKKRFIT
jgi:hypothetical protein